MEKKRREPKEPEVTLDGVPRMFGPHRQGLTDEGAMDAWGYEVEQAADEMQRQLAEMERRRSRPRSRTIGCGWRIECD